MGILFHGPNIGIDPYSLSSPRFSNTTVIKRVKHPCIFVKSGFPASQPQNKVDLTPRANKTCFSAAPIRFDDVIMPNESQDDCRTHINQGSGACLKLAGSSTTAKLTVGQVVSEKRGGKGHYCRCTVGTVMTRLNRAMTRIERRKDELTTAFRLFAFAQQNGEFDIDRWTNC